jgi:hypothetical protein
MIEVGPIEFAPDVRWISQYIEDDLQGQCYSFHFKTGVVALNTRQEEILERSLVPLLKGAGSVVEIYGLADRTGSKQVNYDVSRQRLWYVEFYLNNVGVSADIAFSPKNKYFGEDYAEHENLQDSTSNFYQRCVLVWWWPNYQSSIRIFNNKPFLRYARSTPQP